ncbi:MAG: hypothetical protein K2Q21_11885 [Chitinophagaceae bacterium]|nr:hypothetical protein [Chitinophagaceae bacterium]
MKPILLILLIVVFTACSGNRQKAIHTICTGVEKTGKKCGSAMGLISAGVVNNSFLENPPALQTNTNTNNTILEVNESRLVW